MEDARQFIRIKNHNIAKGPSLSDQRRDFFICERRIDCYPYQLDNLNFYIAFRNLYRSSVQEKRSRELPCMRHTNCKVNSVSGATVVKWNPHTIINYGRKFMRINENINLHHARNACICDRCYIRIVLDTKYR